MSATIWKFSFLIQSSHVQLLMPKDAVVVHVECQRDVNCLWALVDANKPNEHRHFRVFGTGGDMGDFTGNHIGSWQSGPYVWHMFEDVHPPAPCTTMRGQKFERAWGTFVESKGIDNDDLTDDELDATKRAARKLFASGYLDGYAEGLADAK